MGRSCYCCEKCYKKIIVIAIYDESEPNYCSNNSAVYDNDLFEWNTLIDYHSRCSHDIIAGLMVPDINGCISAPGKPLPKDTDNNEWLIQRYPVSYPRLTTSQIVNFFYSLINRSNDSNFIPELLVFVLDNSGSILIGQYQEELKNAKAQIKNSYPDLIILDDVSSADERWIRDSKIAVNNRLCLCECDSNSFRSLFDLPSSSFEGISDFPQEVQDHSVEKVKINLAGFKDWSYSGSYSGLFSSVYQGSDSNPIFNVTSFGNATVDFNINAYNLSIFNREYIFNKQNRICRECCDMRYSGNKVDRYSCIYSIEEEYLGDIDISFKIELSNISGTVYAKNLFVEVLAKTYLLPPEPPFNGAERCESRNIGSCNGIVSQPPFRLTRFFQGDINSELTGSLFINYKFSVFVQAKDKLMNKITSCNQPPNSGSLLSFAWILKETKYTTSGVYDNLGLMRIEQNIQCDCHPEICSRDVSIRSGRQCLITNCEKKVINHYSNCRSIFHDQFIDSSQLFFSDTYQKFVESFDTDIRVKCKIAYPVKHSNIKVRSPFNIFSNGLPSICYLDLIGPPPPDATWKCDEYNDGFFMDCSWFGMTDYEWNDASKIMTTKLLACGNFAYPIINFSKGFLIPSNQYVNTSYFSETNACFVGHNNKCNNSNNTGFLVENFWSKSLSNLILNYIMNIKQRNRPLQNHCDDYTEDKTGVFNLNGIGSFPSLPFSNAIVPVPSVMYGQWVDQTPVFQFNYNPSFEMFQESNEFSRYFSVDNWRAVAPTATSIVLNPNSSKSIQPYFILSKPLEIDMRIDYE